MENRNAVLILGVWDSASVFQIVLYGIEFIIKPIMFRHSVVTSSGCMSHRLE